MNQEKQPLVSILMTVYNREKFITEAIESVIQSTYSNWELIIVDDRSTDKSLAIAKSYADNEPRIQIHLNENNLGDYPNRNKAASYAQGEYIKYLDSDDIIYPHGLSCMVKAMLKYPTACMGIPNFREKGLHKLPYQISGKEAYQKHYFDGGLLYTGPTGAIYKTLFFNKIGGFNSDFSVASDLAFNLHCTLNNSIVIFQRDLIWWRPHDGQEINTRQSEYEYLNNQINTFYLNHKECPLSSEEQNQSLRNLKNIQARRIAKYFISLKFSSAIKKMHLLKISYSDIIKSLTPHFLS